MKKICKFIPLLAFLAGCSSVPQGEISMISPTDIPALSLYNFVLSGECTTTTNPATIMPELKKMNPTYDMVVIEIGNGLNVIKNNGTPYKLGTILTGGNTFLIGINKSEGQLPTADDYIVSFTKDSLPDKAFKKVYGDIVDVYANNSKMLEAPLREGKFEGEDIDYIVMAGPAIWTILEDEKPEYIKSYTVASIKDEYGKKFNTTKIIPQAGVFINMNRYNENKELFDTKIKQIKDDLNSAFQNPQIVVDKMNSITEDEQYSLFGQTSSSVEKAINNPEKIGFVDLTQPFDLSAFLQNVGIKDDYSEFIL